MNKQKAIEVLIQAVKIANKKGVYELEDSAVIANAVAIIQAPEPKPEPEKKPEEKKEEISE